MPAGGENRQDRVLKSLAAPRAVTFSSGSWPLKHSALPYEWRTDNRNTELQVVLPVIKANLRQRDSRADSLSRWQMRTDAPAAPDTEILNSVETSRPRSKSSSLPEQSLTSHLYKNPAEGGGNHDGLKREQRWPRIGRRWVWPTVALAVPGLIVLDASLHAGDGDGSAYTVPQEIGRAHV